MKRVTAPTRALSRRAQPLQKADSESAVAPPIPSWKRWLDLSIIVATAPIIAPLMLAIAGMIRVVSDGPVFFRQERIGWRGNPFTCLKFRTMHCGAPTGSHERYLAELMRSGRPMTKLDGSDSRLIPLAWVLRSTGLDELPQLLNIVRGEMSLVGPRPCTLQEYQRFSKAERARTGALPGLTGLWQVNGKNRTTFSRMIELDLQYVATQCLWLDLAIMLRTPAVLCQQVVQSAVERRPSVSPAVTLRRPPSTQSKVNSMLKNDRKQKRVCEPVS